MSALDVSDARALEAALEALPLGTWVEVTPASLVEPDSLPGEDTFDPADYAETLQRVPGGWYLPGDVVIASGDIVDGRPLQVLVSDPL